MGERQHLWAQRAFNGQNVERLSFPITDVSVPETPQQMIEILDTIDECLLSGHGIYVHCWGGVGRTGTVVGCWLKRHFKDGRIKRTPDSDAVSLEQLWKECPKSARKPISPETREQYHYIQDWHESYDASSEVTRNITAILMQHP